MARLEGGEPAVGEAELALEAHLLDELAALGLDHVARDVALVLALHDPVGQHLVEVRVARGADGLALRAQHAQHVVLEQVLVLEDVAHRGLRGRALQVELELGPAAQVLLRDLGRVAVLLADAALLLHRQVAVAVGAAPARFGLGRTGTGSGSAGAGGAAVAIVTDWPACA